MPRAITSSSSTISTFGTSQPYSAPRVSIGDVDWRVYHAINDFVARHSWLGDVFKQVERIGPVLIGAAAVLLWLLARPGSERKWKLAASSSLAAAALGLLVNRIIAAGWDRARPFEAHHVAHIWGARSTDPSFPSDHSSAAFGIA